MLNIFKKSNQKLSRKQFVIKNTLIAILYPLIPLASLIIMSYSGAGDKNIMVFLAIISICSFGFFIHLMAYYVLKKESYDDYEKELDKLSTSNKSKAHSTYYYSRGNMPNFNSGNKIFDGIVKDYYDGRNMMFDIQDLEKERDKIDVVLRKIESDDHFRNPIEITVGNYAMGEYEVNFSISKHELYCILLKQRNLKTAEISEIKHKFKAKFPTDNDQTS